MAGNISTLSSLSSILAPTLSSMIGKAADPNKLVVSKITGIFLIPISEKARPIKTDTRIGFFERSIKISVNTFLICGVFCPVIELPLL